MYETLKQVCLNIVIRIRAIVAHVSDVVLGPLFRVFDKRLNVA